ncbi:MAG: LacI family transcriptional regulator, partial [Spirochaetaceae bacterium]
KAVEYFIDLGHRDIAIISGTTRSTTGFDRVAGYRDAVQTAGIVERSDLLMLDDWGLSESMAYDATERLLSSAHAPTAIIAAHGRAGIGVLRYLRESGRRVPDDVSLICFDDSELFSLHHPAITAIRQPSGTIAAELASLLFRRMSGDIDDRPLTRVVPTELILRESVRSITDYKQ